MANCTQAILDFLVLNAVRFRLNFLAVRSPLTVALYCYAR